MGLDWTSRLISTWDTLRGTYWFIPMLMAFAAAAAAAGFVELDERLLELDIERLGWFERSGPAGARAVLSVIAGSMITVTGVVFSITIVALTLASSQFGPRLLRNFLRDRGNQLVLGTFVATFLYSLLVLRAVDSESVPYVATGVAVGLAIASLFVLIYFVHHAASSIQASAVINAVANEIDEEFEDLFPSRLGEAPEEEVAVPGDGELMGDGRDVHASRSGYVRVVGSDGLIGTAREHDFRVRLVRRPGDFVAEGDVLARVSPADRCDDAAAEIVCQSFVIGSERSGVQDLTFLTGQLTEMAVRALSPGVNDPGTAIACVHRLAGVIGRLSERALPSAVRCDEDGTPRVVADPITFDQLVGACIDPIRRYGAGSASVIAVTIDGLARAMTRCGDAKRREVLREHARGLERAFAASEPSSERDVALVERALEPLQG